MSKDYMKAGFVAKVDLTGSSFLSGSKNSNISLTFPDGSIREFPAGLTGLEVAESIAKSLAKKSVAYALDGELRDLVDPIEQGGKLELVSRTDPKALELIRHYAAHVMAEAVQELWPGTQVTIGPVIENGFYYDFAKNEPFTPEDLPVIEKKMKEIIGRNKPFIKTIWSRDDAKAHFEAKGEKYKVELVDAIPADQSLKMYSQGDRMDLCRGPHMRSTNDIGTAFKLMSVAGAYWRGEAFVDHDGREQAETLAAQRLGNGGETEPQLVHGAARLVPNGLRFFELAGPRRESGPREIGDRARDELLILGGFERNHRDSSWVPSPRGRTGFRWALYSSTTQTVQVRTRPAGRPLIIRSCLAQTGAAG